MIAKALEQYPLRELAEYYTIRSQEALDNEECLRCIATAFYLKQYSKLPFNDV